MPVNFNQLRQKVKQQIDKAMNEGMLRQTDGQLDILTGGQWMDGQADRHKRQEAKQTYEQTDCQGDRNEQTARQMDRQTG
jgi:hypothetical protein